MNDETRRPKWPRSQRFRLSTQGQQAGALFKQALEESRTGGRASFDAAREAWAKTQAVEPMDALYFAELEAKPRTLEEMTKSLDGCGPRKQDVRDAIERLVKQQLVEPLPEAP